MFVRLPFSCSTAVGIDQPQSVESKPSGGLQTLRQVMSLHVLPTPTSSSTRTSNNAQVTSPVLNFQTPVLTTKFTPPPSCTQGHVTMLMSAAYQVWLNEPRPVPNTTFSDCYPPQFMTSFLASVSKTVLPAFSPLVCPDNYFTIYNQTVTSRPLYVACCPR